MARRNKYINTFDTTAQFNTYIDSAEPGFPNVALTKDTGNIHYTSTSPNDHLIYGIMSDPTNAPTFRFNSKDNYSGIVIAAHLDPLNNSFYLDQSDLTAAGVTSITQLGYFMYQFKTNIASLTKLKLDTSAVTHITEFCRYFGGTILDLSACDFSNVTTQKSAFSNVSNLTDVYIAHESTLNVLTNNLTSANNNYIPSSAIIHYGDVDYVWSNGAWVVSN